MIVAPCPLNTKGQKHLKSMNLFSLSITQHWLVYHSNEEKSPLPDTASHILLQWISQKKQRHEDPNVEPFDSMLLYLAKDTGFRLFNIHNIIIILPNVGNYFMVSFLSHKECYVLAFCGHRNQIQSTVYN